MNKCFILFLFLLPIAQFSFSQEVEHNFLVGPQNTSCDSLNLKNLSLGQSIKQIRDGKFRFNQKFRLTRKQGLQSGEFFSCDNKSGYLIIKFNGSEYLYTEVEKGVWIQFISSSDPEGFFLEQRGSLHSWKE